VIKRLVVWIAIFMIAVLPTAFTAPSDSDSSGLDNMFLGNQQVALDVLENILGATDDHGNQFVALSEAEIKMGQSILENLGYNCGGIDGILGPNTQQALRTFQRDRREISGRAIPDMKLTTPEILINIPEYTLSLFEQGKIIRQFDIAVGTPYEQTPTGNFSIFSKIENPTWYPGSNFSDQTPVPPGPDNPLGTRWMEFVPNYGIHGTNKDWDISYPVSGGCIRMHDIEARELYRSVPISTPVVVVYETMRIIEKSDGLYLKVFPDIYQKNTSTQERIQELYEPFAAAGYKMIQQNVILSKEGNEVYEVKIAVKPNVNSVGRSPYNSKQQGTL